MALSDLPGITGTSGKGLYKQLILQLKIFSLFGRSDGRSRN